MTTKPKPATARGPHPLRLTVPESLAREIRRLAEVSQRPIGAVLDAALGDLFAGVTVERVRELWLKRLQAEVVGAVAVELADDGVSP